MRRGRSLVAMAVVVAALGASAKGPARALKDVKLLYFHATWCQSCKRFDGAGVVDQVKEELKGLTVEIVDVDKKPGVVEEYGVEVTPTLILVDRSGFPLGRPVIELGDPEGTRRRIVALVRKMARSP